METQSLRERWFAPVDAASVAVFRIGFGLIMVWDTWKYLTTGWIERYYVRPEFYFKYYGFEWVQPWGGDGMVIHFMVLSLLAALVMVGLTYRFAIVAFTLGFSYVFLLDQTRYLNHFYLVIIFSVLLCVIPAHRQWSFDAWLRPRLRSATLPWWTVWLLRAQMEIVLIYAGLVKINHDWLHLEPLRMWLADRADFPFGLGYLFTQDWSIAVAAYGIIALHLVGAPLLLFKRTRLAVFCIYGAFHVLNHFVFTIGIFPWFTWFGSLIFFDPDWPRQLYARTRRLMGMPAQRPAAVPPAAGYPTPRRQQVLVIAFMGLWLSSQLLIPLRHWLYPGDVAWTEEGHRFAWRMKLRDKEGWAEFHISDPANPARRWHVSPETFLGPTQGRKMATRPDMVLQFSHFLAEHWKEHYDVEDPEVRATVLVSLNGREPALLIDPERDLAKVERNLWHADWITSRPDAPLQTADGDSP